VRKGIPHQLAAANVITRELAHVLGRTEREPRSRVDTPERLRFCARLTSRRGRPGPVVLSYRRE